MDVMSKKKFDFYKAIGCINAWIYILLSLFLIMKCCQVVIFHTVPDFEVGTIVKDQNGRDMCKFNWMVFEYIIFNNYSFLIYQS